MFKNLKRFLNPTHTRNLKVASNEEATFELLVGDLKVGNLSYKDKKWTFKYSEEFKETKGIKTLADFPRIDEVYSNEELWPFFSSRIPSIARPRVKKLIEKEGIDDHDILALLKRFGRQTITNPFELKPLN